VDQRVGGRQQVGHPVGEALHPDAGLAGEVRGQPGAHVLVAPAQGDHQRVGDVQRGGDGSLQVPDRPAAAGHHHQPVAVGHLQVAARLVAVAGDQEVG